MIFIEKPSLISLFNLIFEVYFRKFYKINNRIKIYFFTNANFFMFLFRIFFKDVNVLDFKFDDMTGNACPKIGYHLQYTDLNTISDQIFSNEKYKDIFENPEFNSSFLFYLKKTISGVPSPMYAKLYLLKVIKWNFNNFNKKIYFIPINNLWFDEFYNLCADLNIIYCKNFHLSIFHNLFFEIKYNIENFLYFLAKFRKKKNLNNLSRKNSILVRYFSNLNISNPHYFSDIFFYHAGKIQLDRFKVYISTKNHLLSKDDIKDRSKHPVDIININPLINDLSIYSMNYPDKDELFRKRFKFKKRLYENKYIEYCYDDYCRKKNIYKNLIRKTNAKIHLTHFKFGNDHIVMHDIFNELQGINILWQLSYDELSTYGSSVKSDIYFSQSYYNLLTEKNNKSQIDYHIITGYPGDYRFNLIKNKKNSIKKNLQNYNQKKIISFFDENSTSNYKFGAGNALNLLDYKFLFEKLLTDNNLVIIFKPKKYETIFYRLRPIEKLLTRAINSKRCFFLTSTHTSIAPANASIFSDLSIHCSLYAATAGVESILSGTTTFFLDRENWKISKLYNYGKNKFVFDNWDTLWNEVEKYFNDIKRNFNFYHNSELLNYLDPYRDGQSSLRIAEYINDLLAGYDLKMNKKEIIEKANIQFKKKWGNDKINSF